LFLIVRRGLDLRINVINGTGEGPGMTGASPAMTPLEVGDP
jgi:hypothetical protein